MNTPKQVILAKTTCACDILPVAKLAVEIRATLVYILLLSPKTYVFM